MHTLHRILVYVPEATDSLNGNPSREELLETLRNFAEDRTELYRNEAFSCREIDTAGAWDDEYPENVLLGSENKEKILHELRTIRKAQWEEIQSCLSALGELANFSLKETAERLWRLDKLSAKREPESHIENFSTECLSKMIRYLCGEYFYGSFFYDTKAQTALVKQNAISKVIQSPEKWALVLFDCHF